MRVIFGIGNPGSGFHLNRHNVGFLFLDQFALIQKLNFQASKADNYFASGILEGNKYILAKPTTFVNRSGVAAEQIIREYEFQLNDFLIIVDDINLSLGEYRIRLAGGDGGHNGLKSIIYSTGSDLFPRIRIGISSKPADKDLAEYVLENFSEDEFEKIKITFNEISLLVKEFIIGGSQSMLNLNSKLKNPPPENDFN